MSDPYVEVEISVSDKFTTSIHVADIVYAIKELPAAKQWNAIAAILNNVEDALISALTNEQRQIIVDYLTRQLKRFEP